MARAWRPRGGRPRRRSGRAAGPGARPGTGRGAPAGGRAGAGAAGAAEPSAAPDREPQPEARTTAEPPSPELGGARPGEPGPGGHPARRAAAADGGGAPGAKSGEGRTGGGRRRRVTGARGSAEAPEGLVRVGRRARGAKAARGPAPAPRAAASGGADYGDAAAAVPLAAAGTAAVAAGRAAGRRAVRGARTGVVALGRAGAAALRAARARRRGHQAPSGACGPSPKAAPKGDAAHGPGEGAPGRKAGRGRRAARAARRAAAAAGSTALAAGQEGQRPGEDTGDAASAAASAAAIRGARTAGRALGRAGTAALRAARKGSRGAPGGDARPPAAAARRPAGAAAGGADRRPPAPVSLPSKPKAAPRAASRAWSPSAGGRPAKARPGAAAADPLASLQARRNYMRSRALRRAGRAAGPGASRTAALAGRAAVRAASSGARAAVASAASAAAALLGPLLAMACLAAAAAAVVWALISMLSCTAAMEPEGQRGARIASVALEEYRSGEADGTYHDGDAKYWEFVNGEGTYVDGSATPWCACFVSWCAAQAGGLEELFPGPLASVQGFIGWFQARPELGSVYDIEEAPQPRAGDLICFGSTGNVACTDHIGIVVEVGDDGWAFTTVEGNTGYSLGGTGGHVYEHTYRAGPDWSLSGATWAYAKVIRPNYPASGGTVEIPETCDYSYHGSGRYAGLGGSWTGLPLGRFASWECEPLTPVISWDTSSETYRVMTAWRDAGSVYDDAGFARLNGKYMVACTEKFGQVGDEVVFYLDDGTALDCVVTDTKDQTEAYGPWPANEWGHPAVVGDEYSPSAYVTEVGVLEFFGHVSGSPYYKMGIQGRRTASAENLGRYTGL